MCFRPRSSMYLVTIKINIGAIVSRWQYVEIEIIAGCCFIDSL